MALPEKGSRVPRRSRRCIYVYHFTERRYDAERGRTVNDRVAVGKLCPDGETMWPNDRWLEILGRLTESHAVAKYRSVGVFLALRAALEGDGALGALRESLPLQWERLVAVVTHVVDDRSADAQGLSHWCHHDYCGFAEPFSSSFHSPALVRLAPARSAQARIVRFCRACRAKASRGPRNAMSLRGEVDIVPSRAIPEDGRIGAWWVPVGAHNGGPEVLGRASAGLALRQWCI